MEMKEELRKIYNSGSNKFYNHGFKLVADNRERKIGLFENKVIMYE